MFDNENGINNVKTILDFLGEENQQKIKDAMTDALIENLEESIRQEYVICPEEVYELWNNFLEKCMKNTLKKYKEDIQRVIDERVEEIVNNMKEEIKK